MDTTKLIVEYLIAGILMITAVLALLFSLFPEEFASAFNMVVAEGTPLSLIAQATIATVFLSFAYAVGVISEYLAERVFEGKLNSIKQTRMQAYLRNNKTLLQNSVILKPYVEDTPSDKDKQSANLAGLVGKLRFYILNNSTELYTDVGAQINRFRLIRVFFLAELIFITAIVVQLGRSFNWISFSVLVLLIIMAVANYYAVRSRFGRYCRAVERSYTILLQKEVN